jgi:hypothetical protein
MALAFTLNGENFLSQLDFSSVAVQQSREARGATMDFALITTVQSEPIRPLAGMEVIFTDGSTREFAGTLISLDYEQGEANNQIIWYGQCTDYTYLLDRRFLNQIYTSQAAGAMAGEILDDLQSFANDESASGDDHYDDFQGDKSLITTGPTIRQQRFERILPSQALEIIAEASGMLWWIDFNKVLNLSLLANIHPTFLPLDEEGNRILEVETNTTDFFNLRVIESIEGIGTKSIIENAEIRSTAQFTDAIQWNTGDPLVIPFSRRPFSDLNIVSIIRTRGTQTFTQRLEDIYLAATDAPVTNEVAVYVGTGSSNSVAYMRFLSTDLQNGDVITATYNYLVADSHENLQPEDDRVSILADRTGGDGIHEFVFSQASGIVASDLEDLDEVSEIILARKSSILYTGQFDSLTKGWQPGQIFRIFHPRTGFDQIVYVVNVRKTIRTPADEPTVGDNIIQSSIQFSNIPRGVHL